MQKLVTVVKLQGVLLLFALNAFPQQGHWDTLATKNQVKGRSECGMAACDGKLYLIGGDGKIPVQVFDPKTLSWSDKSTPPVAMNHFEAVALKNNIYVLEAFEGGSFPNQTNTSRVYIYDTRTDAWHTGAGLAPERRRAAAGAAEYGGKIYLVDGIRHGHSSGTTNMFDVYDPVTDQWAPLPDAPHIRDHCEAAVADDKLYVAGGRNTSFRDPKGIVTFFSQTVLEVDCYDFKTGRWTTLSAKLPLGTGGGSMVNLKGILYYMGGERATATERNAPRKNTFYLNPSQPDQWIETDSLKFGRNGMSAAVFQDKIYAFGGAGGGGPMPKGPAPGSMPMNMPNDSTRRPPPGPPPEQGFSPLEVFRLKN
jgi:N-acetylneuraminic acid mutarotase